MSAFHPLRTFSQTFGLVAAGWNSVPPLAIFVRRNGVQHVAYTRGAETAERAMSRFFRDNGLTIVLLLLFVASIVGHWITGWHFHNEQLQDHGREPITLIAFLSDPQFLSTVFENWESEFLQMSAYVVLTAYLFQRGSAGSTDPDEPARPGDTTSRTTKRGCSGCPPARSSSAVGIRPLARARPIPALHSLLRDALDVQRQGGGRGSTKPRRDAADPSRISDERQLWFESFQNWQSEFLSTAVIVVLSIFLREVGSPGPSQLPHHAETGA